MRPQAFGLGTCTRATLKGWPTIPKGAEPSEVEAHMAPDLTADTKDNVFQMDPSRQIQKPRQVADLIAPPGFCHGEWSKRASCKRLRSEEEDKEQDNPA